MTSKKDEGPMGVRKGKLDRRLQCVLELMEVAPVLPGGRVLEVGIGSGELALRLCQRGQRVTGTGMFIESYDCDIVGLLREGVRLLTCTVEALPLRSECFDGVVLSHVLEHSLNVGAALAECHRVLKNDGWLMVFVPPHIPEVCAGHVSVGWSIGQLMYVLLLCGFCVADGRFVQWSGSVCGFVKKDRTARLPALRCDRGDLQALSRADLFPGRIRSGDGNDDGFIGVIGALNWNSEHLGKLQFSAAVQVRVAAGIARLVPRRIHIRLARLFIAIGQVIFLVHNVNPTELTD